MQFISKQMNDRNKNKKGVVSSAYEVINLSHVFAFLYIYFNYTETEFRLLHQNTLLEVKKS